jgi:hypothetical protein
MINNVYESIKGITIVNDTNLHAVQALEDKNASLKDIFATAGNLGASWFDTLSSLWQSVLIGAIVVSALVLIAWLIMAVIAYRKADKELQTARKEGCGPINEARKKEAEAKSKAEGEAAAAPEAAA